MVPYRYGLAQISLVLIRGFRAKVAIAKVTNAGYNIKLTINLRIQSGSNNFHLHKEEHK